MSVCNCVCVCVVFKYKSNSLSRDGCYCRWCCCCCCTLCNYSKTPANKTKTNMLTHKRSYIHINNTYNETALALVRNSHNISVVIKCLGSIYEHDAHPTLCAPCKCLGSVLLCFKCCSPCACVSLHFGRGCECANEIVVCTYVLMLLRFDFRAAVTYTHHPYIHMTHSNVDHASVIRNCSSPLHPHCPSTLGFRPLPHSRRCNLLPHSLTTNKYFFISLGLRRHRHHRAPQFVYSHFYYYSFSFAFLQQ